MKLKGQGTLIHRKDGRYEARLPLAGGKYKSFYHADPNEAIRLREAARRDIERGLSLPDGRETLRHFLAGWIEGLKAANLRASSWRRYESIVRVHLIPEPFGSTKLKNLTQKQQVLAFLAQKKQEGLSTTTLGHIHSVLRRALRDAEDDGLVARNVCKQIKAPRRAEHEMIIFSKEEAGKFLEEARKDRQFALYVLALATGMRQGELLGLRWRDVTLNGPKPALQVRMQVVEKRETSGYRRALDELKTKGSRRRIELGTSLVQTLKAHQARQELEKRIARDARLNNNLGLPHFAC